MKKSLFSDEEHNIWLFLQHIHQALIKAIERELHTNNITPEQAATLFCIQVLNDKATLTNISHCMIREHHTVASLIRRMESKGLVNKVIPPMYRKTSARVRLTKKGERAYKVAANRESLHRVMSVLTDEEKIQLRKILEKLRHEAIKELAVVHEPMGPPPLDTT